MPKPNRRAAGSDYKYQISSVTECSLRGVGTLPFSMYRGSCFNANEHIVLCFGDEDKNQCYRSNQPLTGFSAIARSRHEHSRIRMASSKSKLTCPTNITMCVLECTASPLVVLSHPMAKQSYLTFQVGHGRAILDTRLPVTFRITRLSCRMKCSMFLGDFSGLGGTIHLCQQFPNTIPTTISGQKLAISIRHDKCTML